MDIGATSGDLLRTPPCGDLIGRARQTVYSYTMLVDSVKEIGSDDENARSSEFFNAIGAFKRLAAEALCPHIDPRRRFGRSGESGRARRSARMSCSAATAAATAPIARARGTPSTRREIRRHAKHVVPRAASSLARASSREAVSRRVVTARAAPLAASTWRAGARPPQRRRLRRRGRRRQGL